MKRTQNNFLKSIFILIIAQVLTKLLGLIYTLYLINREGFGDSGNAIYASAYQIYALLLTMSSIGVPNAISKIMSERIAIGDWKGAQRKFKVAIFIFSAIGLIGTLTLFLGAKYISTYLLQIPEAGITLMVLSPSIFFVAIASVLKGYFNGIDKINATAESQIIEQVAKTIFTVLIVEIIAKISNTSTIYMAYGATIATTLAVFFGFIYLIYYYFKLNKVVANEIYKSVNYKKERICTISKNIFNVSVPIALSSIMAGLTKNIDSVTVVRILKNFMDVSNAKINYGILSGKIETIVVLPLSFNYAFITVLVPAVSAAKAVNQNKIIEEKINLSVFIGMMISIPCTIGMIFFSEQILNLLFPNSSGGIELLKISSISITFVILAQTISGVLQGMGKQNVPAKAFGIGIIIKIICNLLLIRIPWIGINGAAIGTVLCNIVAFLITYIEFKKISTIKIKFYRYFINIFIASSIMIIISYFTYTSLLRIINENIATIIMLIIAIFIYIICIIILNIDFCKKIAKICRKN